MTSLVIAPAFPSDTGNGLAMRIGMFAEAFRALGDVDVLVVQVAGGEQRATPLCRRLGIVPKAIDVAGRGDTQLALVRGLADPERRLQAFVAYGKPSLVSFLSIPVLADVRQYLAQRLYERIHISRSYLLPLIEFFPRTARSAISVDLDEDDVQTYRSIAALRGFRGDLIGQKWDEAEAVAFDRLIGRWLPSTGTAFISNDAEAEAMFRRYGKRPIVVPNAVDLPSVSTTRPSAGPIVFVGSFGYLPNLDAAEWLAEEIMPLFARPNGRDFPLKLVGRGASPQLKAKAASAGIEILQDVEDLAQVYAEAAIAVVPLRAGGGSRIKLLEAAAHGVPIVSTSVGAENTGLEDNRHLWIADTADAIISACLALRADPREALRRAAAASMYVTDNHCRKSGISTLTQRLASREADADTKTGGRA